MKDARIARSESDVDGERAEALAGALLGKFARVGGEGENDAAPFLRRADARRQARHAAAQLGRFGEWIVGAIQQLVTRDGPAAHADEGAPRRLARLRRRRRGEAQ